jgi:hypothetical protein
MAQLGGAKHRKRCSMEEFSLACTLYNTTREASITLVMTRELRKWHNLNQLGFTPSAQTEPATFDDLTVRVKRKWLADGSNSFPVITSYPCLTSIVNATNAHSLHRPRCRCVYGPIADIVILANSMVQLGRSLQRPYFCHSQSRLSSGHTWRVLSHLEMQWKWKACCRFPGQYIIQVEYIPAELTLQMPHATVHSSLVADAWLAWQSMHRSMMWLRQMAQLSTTMSQAQRATAFHCVGVSLPK